MIVFVQILFGLSIKFIILSLEKSNLYVTFALYVKKYFSETD